MTALDLADRWAGLLHGPQGIVDQARWAHTIGYGPATPRRPGDPRGRDLTPEDTETETRRPDYQLPGLGQHARRALRSAHADLLAAEQHTIGAAALIGVRWEPARAFRSQAEHIELVGHGLVQAAHSLERALTSTAVVAAHNTIERHLEHADTLVTRADSTLAKALQTELTTAPPPKMAKMAKRCANQTDGCPGLPKPHRTLCDACRRHLARHAKKCPDCKAKNPKHTPPQRPGIRTSPDRLGPIEAARDAKARRAQRGENHGAEDLSGARRPWSLHKLPACDSISGDNG